MADAKPGPKDWRKSKAYKDVRREILSILERVQRVDALTLSRVDEYMDFWALRHQLQDDIATRGIYVTDERGRTTENRSASLSIQTSRQMEDLLAALQIRNLNAPELDEL